MKTIIYLDHNYVSWITKARLGVNVYPAVASYYSDLYSALRDAVKADLVICPVSQFHHSESQLDPRLAPEIFRTLQDLYCGIEFLSFVKIIQEQVTGALSNFLGLSQPSKPRWKEAFANDPHRRSSERAEPIQSIGLFRDVSRKTKAYQ